MVVATMLCNELLATSLNVLFANRHPTEAPKINKQKLNCNILDVDRYKRLIGECFKRNINLNSWMVSNGYAVAYRKYSKKYVSDEINAKNNKLGIWQGKFEMPWDYRRKN